MSKPHTTNSVSSIAVLVSTMNEEDPSKLAKRMNINKFVIINQLTTDGIPTTNNDKQSMRIISCRERGLSKSRNLAIKNSNADICLLADNDMTYVNNYEKIVIDAYSKYPTADIIAFDVNKKGEYKKIPTGRVKFLKAMKLNSVRISFRRKSVIGAGIKFDENFGAGTHNYMGEENIFLADCLKHGMKIYYLPIKIATLEDSSSTWFSGYNKEYFRVRGRAFRRMAPHLTVLLIAQFALRKQRLYRKDVGTIAAIYYMLDGAITL